MRAQAFDVGPGKHRQRLRNIGCGEDVPTEEDAGRRAPGIRQQERNDNPTRGRPEQADMTAHNAKELRRAARSICHDPKSRTYLGPRSRSHARFSRAYWDATEAVRSD